MRTTLPSLAVALSLAGASGAAVVVLVRAHRALIRERDELAAQRVAWEDEVSAQASTAAAAPPPKIEAPAPVPKAVEPSCDLWSDDQVQWRDTPELMRTVRVVTTRTENRPHADVEEDLDVRTTYAIGTIKEGVCQGYTLTITEVALTPYAACKSGASAEVVFAAERDFHVVARVGALPALDSLPVLEVPDDPARMFRRVGYALGAVSTWNHYDNNTWYLGRSEDGGAPEGLRILPQRGGWGRVYEPIPAIERMPRPNDPMYCEAATLPAESELLRIDDFIPEDWVTNSPIGAPLRRWQVRDPAGPLSRRLYDALLAKLGQGTGYGMPLPTFEEFQRTPTTFFVDWAGRTRMCGAAVDARPFMAEPLVYAYAPVDTDVEIRLGEGIDVAIARPALIDRAWRVRTGPRGLPEPLFWEGRAWMLEPPTRGIVAAQAEIGDVLERELRARGLIEQEIAAFLAYWTPRLSESPYTLLRFVPQEQIDQMAPLRVTPRPDVVIRVHLDAVALEEPVEVEPETADAPPARHGLVIVEWSGFVR